MGVNFCCYIFRQRNTNFNWRSVNSPIWAKWRIRILCRTSRHPTRSTWIIRIIGLWTPPWRARTGFSRLARWDHSLPLLRRIEIDHPGFCRADFALFQHPAPSDGDGAYPGVQRLRRGSSQSGETLPDEVRTKQLGIARVWDYHRSSSGRYGLQPCRHWKSW